MSSGFNAGVSVRRSVRACPPPGSWVWKKRNGPIVKPFISISTISSPALREVMKEIMLEAYLPM